MYIPVILSEGFLEDCKYRFDCKCQIFDCCEHEHTGSAATLVLNSCLWKVAFKLMETNANIYLVPVVL